MRLMLTNEKASTPRLVAATMHILAMGLAMPIVTATIAIAMTPIAMAANLALVMAMAMAIMTTTLTVLVITAMVAMAMMDMAKAPITAAGLPATATATMRATAVAIAATKSIPFKMVIMPMQAIAAIVITTGFLGRKVLLLVLATARIAGLMITLELHMRLSCSRGRMSLP